MVASLFLRWLSGRHWRAGVVLVAALTGCQGPPTVAFASDYEEFTGWSTQPPPPGFTSEQAHSGTHAIKIEQNQEFTPAYSGTLGTSLPFLPRQVALNAWAYLPDGRVRSSMLVVTVQCHGRRPDVWVALNLDQVVKRYGQWVSVQHRVSLPADLAPDDQLLAYVWHREAGTVFYLDDLSFEAWP